MQIANPYGFLDMSRDALSIFNESRLPIIKQPPTHQGSTAFDFANPVSVTKVRDIFDWSSTKHVRLNGSWFIRNQETGINDKVEVIEGGVFIIDCGDSGRAGFLIRNRTKPLTFINTIFIGLGNSRNQEALVYVYENDIQVNFLNCVFAGLPEDQSKQPTIYSKFTSSTQPRAVSIKSSRGKVSSNVLIHGSTFRMQDERNKPTGGVGAAAIDVSGVVPDQRGFYVRHKRPVDVLNPVSNITITQNDIQGGYYGIGMSGVESFKVEGNAINGNMRGVSLQDTSRDGRVVFNAISECVSSGVHMAYGSRSILVEGNTITSFHHHGQGLIQAYCSVRDVVIKGNLMQSNEAKFHVYIGNGSDDIKVLDNRFLGRASANYIQVETSWTQGTHYLKHYPGDADLSNPQGVFNLSVKGNQFQFENHLGIQGTEPVLIPEADVMTVDDHGTYIMVDEYPNAF